MTLIRRSPSGGVIGNTNSFFPYFGCSALDQDEFLAPFQQNINTSSIPTGRSWVVPCEGLFTETFVQLSSPLEVDATFVIRQHIEGVSDTDILTVVVPAGVLEIVDSSILPLKRGYNIQVINRTPGNDLPILTVVTFLFVPLG